MDGAKNPARFPDDFFALGFPRNVRLDSRRLPSGILNLGNDCEYFAFCPRRYCDRRTLFRKFSRYSPADSAAAAGNNRNSFC